MACRIRSTEALRGAGLGRSAALALALAAVFAPGRGAFAHPQAPQVARDLVRLQGQVGAAAAGEKTVRELVLVAAGKELRLLASDWRRFSSNDKPALEPERERGRYEVRGSRADLARLAAVRPDQRVTILAEQRPGSADLFLLALDLCPPR